MAATNISASFRKEFDSNVKLAYQEKGNILRPLITHRSGIKGTTYQFNTYGKVNALEYTGNGTTDVDGQAVTSGGVEVTLKDVHAPVYAKKFDEDKVTFDEKTAIKDGIVKALGRKEDQYVLDALDAATLPATNIIAADYESSGTDTGLTVAKILAALDVFDAANVSPDNRYLVAPASAKKDVIADKDFQSNLPAVQSWHMTHRLDELYGIKFIWIGDETVNGVKTGLAGVGTNDRKAFLFQKEAVGIATGSMDQIMEINYIPEKISTLFNALARVNAAVIDPTGVVEISIVTK